jgi:multiple sugar transport system permease protein
VSQPSATETTVVAALPALDRRRARRKAAWRRRAVVFAFLSPWLAGVIIFFAYPLLMSLYLSFTHFDNLSPPRWIGLANYRYLFHGDMLIGPAVRNSLWMIVFAMPKADRT